MARDTLSLHARRTVLRAAVVCLCVALSVTQAAAGEKASTLRFGEVQIVYDTPISDAARATLSEQSARLFRGITTEVALKDGLDRLTERLATAGYHYAIIAPRDFHVVKGTLAFTIRVLPGDRTIVGGWRFVGLTHTDTTWLARVLDLPVGIPWSDDLYNLILDAVASVSHCALTEPPRFEFGADRSRAVVVLSFVERPQTTFGGALAASSNESQAGATQLTGRASLDLHGLFSRDRTAILRYNRPAPGDRRLLLGYRESGVFGTPLSWNLELEQWDQAAQRQTVAAAIGYTPRRHLWRFEASGRYRRVGPGTEAEVPVRISELGVAVQWGLETDVPPILRSQQTWWQLGITLSRRRVIDSDAAGADRTRTNLSARWGHLRQVVAGFYTRTAFTARLWLDREAVARGDEWYLGGEEGFSGYADRSLVAADGLTGLYEIGKLWRSGIGVATLAETGWLRPLPEGGDQIQRPYSYGFAVLLNGRSRSGRLEAGWRDHARWADGVLRLSVSQRW